jgi:aspartate aminotransferase
MPIADRMVPRVAAFAVIKNMFEEGRRLKAEFGPDNVYDFSLGTPMCRNWWPHPPSITDTHR